MLSWPDLKVVVVGLAREGQAAAQFLAQRGAKVTVTDANPAERLRKAVAALQGTGVNFALGGHPERLLNPDTCDFLVVSPGVPLSSPFLQQAQRKRLPLTTESRLFCQLCPAPIIGISGSSGKTTTTTLTGKMLRAAGYNAPVGGNIGQPLLNRLDEIRAADWVVLELSSFQLEYFHASLNQSANIPPQLRPFFADWSPKIAALLNITPNHLDRHKTMAAYTQAKRALVDYLGPNQPAVLGWDNPVTQAIGQQLNAPVRWFSLRQRVKNGACLVEGQISLLKGGAPRPVCPAGAVKLRGQHNLYNVLAACAIADAADVDAAAMAQAATGFSGVPHRLELVTRQKGVAWYNDSIATSPERLMAALKSFDEPIILLAGGKDKDLPWEDAARLITQRVKHLILFGQARKLIFEAVEEAITNRPDADPGKLPTIDVYRTLEEAVARAKTIARPGDVALLSPGGTSYDAYHDFAARGEHFRQLAMNN